MFNIRVYVSGCDDTTIVELEVNKHDFKVIETLAEVVTAASTYGCMPTMRVEKL